MFNDGSEIRYRIHRRAQEKRGPIDSQITDRQPTKPIQPRLQCSHGSLWGKSF